MTPWATEGRKVSAASADLLVVVAVDHSEIRPRGAAPVRRRVARALPVRRSGGPHVQGVPRHEGGFGGSEIRLAAIDANERRRSCGVMYPTPPAAAAAITAAERLR